MIDRIQRSVRERYLLTKYIRPFVKSNLHRAVTPERNICLFCQPRGGSAWLSEIIATLPTAGIMDEPLWSGPYKHSDMAPAPYNYKLKEVADLGFYFNQPIPEKEDWPEAKMMFHKLLTGQQNSLHLYEEMDIKNLQRYDIYITKFNKANLLFHWLRRNFNFKSIVLLRHPCATISSQILGHHFDNAKAIPLAITPNFRYSQYFEQYKEIWKSIKTHEEYLAFIWSVNVKEVVNHPDRNMDYLIVCYESLLTRFDFELERIFRYLNHRTPLAAKELERKPSPTTKPNSIKYLKSGMQLGAWRDRLPQRQFNNIMGVVKRFGIDFYNEDLEPNYDDIYGCES